MTRTAEPGNRLDKIRCCFVSVLNVLQPQRKSQLIMKGNAKILRNDSLLPSSKIYVSLAVPFMRSITSAELADPAIHQASGYAHGHNSLSEKNEDCSKVDKSP